MAKNSKYASKERKSPIQRAEDYLSKKFLFRYNVILSKVEYANKQDRISLDLNDYKINSILRELRCNGIVISKSELIQTLRSEFVPQYDPFKRYFDTLQPWDGQTDYIAQLANTIAVDEQEKENWDLYLRRWLIGVVASATEAKEVNQTVLILVGGQGIGKTKWMDRLVPKGLSRYYYSGNINPNDKDTKVNLAECLLINMDELENLNKGEIGTLKQLITLPTIRLRRPYASIPETMTRRASFMGSVNSMDFLRDETGNRRFLCVEALQIDYAHHIDMDNVYAQAKHLFDAGERYWFNNEENLRITEANEKYKSFYHEIELVTELYDPCPLNEEPDILLTTSELQKELSKRENLAINLSLRRLGMALRLSPYKRAKVGGLWKWRLKRKEKEQE